MNEFFKNNPYKLKFVEEAMPTSTGVDFGYAIEVRMSKGSDPLVSGDQIIVHDWVRLHPVQSPIGVRNSPWGKTVEWAGYMTREAADALRHWFIADVAATSYVAAMGLETRLVCYKIEYSRKCYRQIDDGEETGVNKNTPSNETN